MPPTFRADTPATRLATRLVFFVAGFAVSCWAPLVPYAKDRLVVDEHVLGILLLCLGIGSLVAMAFTGTVSSRLGTRPVILASGLGLCITVPFLALAATPVGLGVTLLFFGAALGSLDVAVNIHAVEVERDAGQPLMSGFHAQYSLGGVVGALFITLLLSLGASPFVCVAVAAAIMFALIAVSAPRLLRTKTADGEPHFAWPRGVVLVLAMLAAISFLAEGTMLDWSALLITSEGLVAVEQGGIGFVLFSVAMTAMRFGGDALTARIGDRPTLVWGGLVAIGGFALLLLAPVAAVAMAGFVAVGLGAANIVPVLFRRAGSQTVMPPGLAIAAVTATGYAGILLGPAAIGFLAKHLGLATAFWVVPAILVLVPLCATVVTGKADRRV
jgi:predicted MFS family arabinose efflux permease